MTTPVTMTSNLGLGLGGTPTTNPVSAPTTNTGLQNTSTGTTAVSASLAPINFRQLQELINKWTIDVEDQEKEFIDLATKVNYWDKILMSNGDKNTPLSPEFDDQVKFSTSFPKYMQKISKMSDSIERVKAEHERMENILDYVKNYQKDFEGFLENLEANSPPITVTTPERAEFYSTSEKLNTDLQQISEDLKEVIRHINVSNKLIDRTDPVSQILRILNEHTDALQWIEDQTAVVKESLDDVAKMHQVFRRDQERSLRLMFKPN